MMTCAPAVRTPHGVLHAKPRKNLEHAMWSPDTLWTTMYASVCAGQVEMPQSWWDEHGAADSRRTSTHCGSSARALAQMAVPENAKLGR